MDLKKIFEHYPGIILDGELYSDEMPFQELCGLIKKKKIEETDLKRLLYISYYIYDSKSTLAIQY